MKKIIESMSVRSMWGVAALTLAHSLAQADVPASVASNDQWIVGISPACQLTTYADSFARGIKDVIYARPSGDGLSFKGADWNCYELGRQFAMRTMADMNLDREGCLKRFADGRAPGYRAESVAGDGCFMLGHSSGNADRRIAARENDFASCGRDCRAYYCQGHKDWNRGDLGGMPSGLGTKNQACYQQGLFEGVIPEFACR